jgi:transcriptional regulatory protein RtcR
MNLFNEVQLRELINICRHSRSLADASPKLFAVSRKQQDDPKDTDRPRKYVADSI